MIRHLISKLKYLLHRKDREIEKLYCEIEDIKLILEKARVALFIHVVEYKRGMNLCDERPKPISLESLERRISTMENFK